MGYQDYSLNRALIIFIRNAEKGKVKTRLAASLGDDEALRIYMLLQEMTRKVALETNADRLLFYSNFMEAADEWSAADFQKSVQRGSELGERIADAFRVAFEHHKKVIIVGSDCPSLDANLVETAFELLEDNDFVIGPAQDGGYYLIGMRRFMPFVFEDMTWSHAAVFVETVRRIKENGASLALLKMLSDIDTIDDWRGWLSIQGE